MPEARTAAERGGVRWLRRWGEQRKLVWSAPVIGRILVPGGIPRHGRDCGVRRVVRSQGGAMCHKLQP